MTTQLQLKYIIVNIITNRNVLCWTSFRVEKFYAQIQYERYFVIVMYTVMSHSGA